MVATVNCHWNRSKARSWICCLIGDNSIDAIEIEKHQSRIKGKRFRTRS